MVFANIVVSGFNRSMSLTFRSKSRSRLQSERGRLFLIVPLTPFSSNPNVARRLDWTSGYAESYMICGHLGLIDLTDDPDDEQSAHVMLKCFHRVWVLVSGPRPLTLAALSVALWPKSVSAVPFGPADVAFVGLSLVVLWLV
jgi:hypothetical protein